MANHGDPDDTELAHLALASLVNAVSLLSDADLLLENSRWPRAYSLGVLAAEEFAKFWSYSVAIGWDGDGRRRLVKDARAHKAKLAVWEGQRVDMEEWGPIESAEAFAEWEQAFGARKDVAAVMHIKKLDGLYVGIDDSERLRHPYGEISEEDAREVFELASSVVMPIAFQFLGENPSDADLYAAAERMVETGQLMGPVIKEMSEAKTRAEREAAVESFREFMHRSTGIDISVSQPWVADDDDRTDTDSDSGASDVRKSP